MNKVSTILFSLIGKIGFLLSLFLLTSFSPAPDCEDCQNTSVVININKATYTGCAQIDAVLNGVPPDCNNSSWYTFNFVTSQTRSVGSYNPNYFKVAGISTFVKCSFIYGGTMTAYFPNCKIRDNDGTIIGMYYCQLNIKIPKI